MCSAQFHLFLPFGRRRRLNNIIYKNQVNPMIYQKNASRVVLTGWQNFYHATLIRI